MRARWLVGPVVGLLLSSCAAFHPSGGASVTRVASPTSLPSLAGYAQLDAPSTDIVWVLVNYRSLFRSSDKGNTWIERSLPPVPGVRPVVSFVDDHDGWLIAPGSPATQCEEATADVWQTTDAAQTWQHLDASGIGRAQCKEQISFVSATLGFITAWDDNHRPTLYRTTDGGRSWTGAVLSDPPDFSSQPGGDTLRINWIRQLGGTLYLEAGGMQADGERHYIFRSSDGGATWSWMTKIPSRYVAMVTESRWLILVVPGQSQETTTSGRQWHPYDSDFNTDTPVGGPQIVFADSQVGYAEGRGSLQRTTDGGAHWARIQTPGVQP